MKNPSISRSTTRKAKWYLWYFVESPFNDPKSPYCFDRDHWWKTNSKDISHDSALYELLRRHPKVGELQRQVMHFRVRAAEGACPPTPNFGSELRLEGPVPLVVDLKNESLQYIATEMQFYSLKSWPKLSAEQREQFQKSLKVTYPGKGRDLTKGVFDLTEMALAAERAERDVGGPSFEELIEDFSKAYATEGRIVLAFDTGFGSKKEASVALKQMADIFWKYWKKPSRQLRSHETDWLTAIQDFECEFSRKGYSQFKLGYPKTFKKLIAHFEDYQARDLRAWWCRGGRDFWAAQQGPKGP